MLLGDRGAVTRCYLEVPFTIAVRLFGMYLQMCVGNVIAVTEQHSSSFLFHVLSMTFSCSLRECGKLVGVTFHTYRRMVLSLDKNVLSAGSVMSTGSINHGVSKSHVNSLTWLTQHRHFRNWLLLLLKECHWLTVLCLKYSSLSHAQLD